MITISWSAIRGFAFPMAVMQIVRFADSALWSVSFWVHLAVFVTAMVLFFEASDRIARRKP